MSEKTEVDQEYDKDEDASQLSRNLPEHQYSREELINISKSSVSGRRPKCLDPAYNSEDGKWDPDRWYKAQFELSGDVSPLTLDGKDRRRATEQDWDVKRKPSVNDTVERLKEEKDGIILSPQRRSFVSGCQVQPTLQYTRQLPLPDRDRDETRRDEKERDRDRDRERPVRKIGSGRIALDRENSRDYSGLRDRFDDARDRDQDRDRDYTWNNRERDRDREWDRDVRDTEWDRDRDRDRRYDRSDRFRRAGDRDFSDRDRRDFRDRGFDRNSRRRNYRDEEKEPEWFTGGPSSQMDTIELRGFDKVTGDGDEAGSSKSDWRNGIKKKTTLSDDKSSKESSEETSEADVKVSQRSSPEEDQQIQQSNHHQEPPDVSIPVQHEEQHATIPQQHSRASPTNNKLFDFDEILKASNLFLQDDDSVGHGSRFSQFFSRTSGLKVGSNTSSIEDMLVPHGLLEDSHTSPALSSPTSMGGPMGTVHVGQVQHGLHQSQDQLMEHNKEHMFSQLQNLMPVPNSAGDNNAGFDKSAVPVSVTALFNSAAHGGSNASISSNSSFSKQDAEAQLKAMLFGGHKDSAPSSGTASPASLPPSVQRKVKTVAELEADMHQSSPQKINSSVSVSAGVSNPASGGDMTAFNKLLIMINAASEASQNATQTDPQTTQAGFGMVASHNEFNQAVMRNKEEQIQLQQQSLQNPQSVHMHPNIPPPTFSLHQQQPPSLISQQLHSSAPFQQLQKPQQIQQQQPAVNHPKQIAGLIKPPGTPGLPQSISSHPNAVLKPRAQSGGPILSSDHIYNLIQHNPIIVMKPASPGPNMNAILASKQSAIPSTARVPSPLMFSQQPPLHLSAPSPIHPGQLSPRSLAMGANLATSTITSPVLPRVPSPQEISAHTQAVMQSALIKKQLQDQSERYQKKQLERARSPSQQQINVMKPPPVTHPGTPTTLQTKIIPVNPFTPTSVLRKMHLDKALEKEKQALEGRGEEDIELMRELSGQNDLMDNHSLDGMSRISDKKLLGDLSDISFLDPINPNLVTMPGQIDNPLKMGQTGILPGPLSQPMSVEEKMKLLALAEKPGYISQILDNSAKVAAAVEAARTGQGRPIVKAQEPSQEDRSLQQHFYAFQQQQPPPPHPMMQGGRPVTGGSQPSFAGVPNMQSGLSQLSSLQQQQNVINKPSGGRAIVGGNSGQQQLPQVPTQNVDVMRMMDLPRLQQIPLSQGMVLPPPPMGKPISCLGPPPIAVPNRICAPSANVAMMHPQIVRANAMNAQHNQQVPHYMVMPQPQQHHKMTPLASVHMVVPNVSSPLNARSQTTGPLSPAALSATIQRVASPHGSLKMNGPAPPSSVNGGGGPKVDMNSGIQRWFSPDILKNQLPSMPPLPAKGNQVMTVDELEGN